MATLRENLIAARALITDFERWTQGTMARDAAGNCFDPNSEWATAWCADGAVCRVAGGDGRSEFADAAIALSNAAAELFDMDPSETNNHVLVNDGEVPAAGTTEAECHAAVLRVYDNAIRIYA